MQASKKTRREEQQKDVKTRMHKLKISDTFGYDVGSLWARFRDPKATRVFTPRTPTGRHPFARGGSLERFQERKHKIQHAVGQRSGEFFMKNAIDFSSFPLSARGVCLFNSVEKG